MATAKIILYKQKVLKSGASPVMLQVVHESRPFRLSLGISSTQELWDEGRCRLKRQAPSSRELNRRLNAVEDKANDIIRHLVAKGEQFTKGKFLNDFEDKVQQASLLGFFNERMKELERGNSLGNHRVYLDTLRALKRYKNLASVKLHDVDYRFLHGFEVHLRENGAQNGGISVYMRTLRAVLNEGMNRGYLDAQDYPFGSVKQPGRYSLAHLKGKKNPRPISVEDMERFKEFVPPSDRADLKLAHLIFLFSYYGQGMNYSDMILLRWTDIQGNRIRYTRKKTHRSMSIPITSPIQGLLEKFQAFGNHVYILPILNPQVHITESQIYNRKKKTLKVFNGSLKEISGMLGISDPITSYTARHTFANTVREKGGSIDLISASMGHADTKVTEQYLKTLSNSQVDLVHKYL